MGNCVSLSIPLDQSVNKVSQWLEEKRGYTHNLKKNLVALETTMEELKAKRDDLERKLTREEDRGLQRLSEFQVWLNRVAKVEDKFNTLVSDKDVEIKRLCLCGFCSKSLLSSYRYGKNVFLTLGEVEKLKSKDIKEIVAKPLTPELEERRLQPIIVGQEAMLEKAWKHLMEDGVSIMGMYGMGGVGKTTLFSQIHNKFSNDRRGFDFVIWVVVSKELHVEKIQDEIAQKVGLGGEQWNQKDKNQKADRLFNFLKKKRFVLFLDDIWEKVELTEIGVPDPRSQKGCKLSFTTRSQEVCARMGVKDPMEVKCLTENVAFDLFQEKVGQITLDCDPGIPDLARTIARKCCGLPLALNVIGETMSCKKTIQEWRHAVEVFNSYAAEFSGMDDKILPLLKYSYDSLKGENIKSCLLYCALFPEDTSILKEELIEYWICEEIIDGSEGIERAEDKGYEIIGSLVRSSLLMEGVNRFGQSFVTMHDVVREMALWIASELGKQKEAFIVRAGVGLPEIPKVKNWNAVRKMSLMENKIRHLIGSFECMELTTLLLGSGLIEMISSEFFNYMPKLAVLDLSHNERLYELPEGISNLVSLQYLNLRLTGTRRLPKKGLRKLKKLIHLDLEYTSNLQSIAGISSLYNLKVLKLRNNSWFLWDLDTVKELESLEHLEILTATINPGLEPFLSSHRLMSCSRFLTISGKYLSSPINIHHHRCRESFGISLSGTMDKLSQFRIEDCGISEIKMGRICSFLSLVEVFIKDCEALRELTFLMFAPNLRKLYVSGANELEDIINKEKACEVQISGIVPFQKLKELILFQLGWLKNIYWSPLPFPCLQTVKVKRCQNLRKLPLNSKSGKQGDNGLVITYDETRWIEGVEWEDEATKIRFLSSCRQDNLIPLPSYHGYIY
ncbi:unnamed protein product [Arabidopsis lyrata]|uniref:probable disease resistance protein At1g63360 n=1 Tax=Arabidopsis lyrata subsp. lyrata TaxID=81972 RepID=UPI000A29B0E9|nr:probable disease resistance protein At1g63360 [Arabidopsis lyrata subsp. lyrata]CAH8256100.1 unnamed protein product [Arabidopsis lyrata]|eukprot:XP_020891049.1 probable disease resistance protein At1g63360 [Arabidopsis lyrata subsp. lyrata]